MTIAYQADVSTSSLLGLWKLVARWRGSVYKLIFREVLVYGTAYAAISFCYRVIMTASQRRSFEKFAIYSDRALDQIPLSFVLGFYVSFVAARWWNQFTTIPWPDRLGHVVLAYVHGEDERGRLLRRTLMRYANLTLVLVLQAISGSVKKRFPTNQHLVEAGFMTTEERTMFEAVPTKVNKHWIPFIWFINLINVAEREGRVQSGPPVKHLLEEVNVFRSKTCLLWCYDWVTVPLVYTQVVTLTTHLFFVTSLVARQSLDPSMKYPGHEVDVYFPFFTFLQFIFFMGWLKVAEQLINPFGEDDDDFETNWLIDRHIQVAYQAVDELYGKVPRVQRDLYWDSHEPDLPYTEASIMHKIPTYRGSTVNIVVPKATQALFSGESLEQVYKGSCRRGLCNCLKRLRRVPAHLSSISIRDDYDRSSPKTLGTKAELFESDYLHLLNKGSLRRQSAVSRRKDSASNWDNFLRGDLSRHPKKAGRKRLQSVSESNESIAEESRSVPSGVHSFVDDRVKNFIDEEDAVKSDKNSLM